MKTYAVVDSDLLFIKPSKGKSVTVVTESKDEKSFGFDGVFKSSDVQNLHKSHFSSLVQDALSGYNVNITCCGLTGTGSGQAFYGSGFSAPGGIVPMVINDLFRSINQNQHLICATMIQVDENDRLTDILNPHPRKLYVKRNQELGVLVDNLTAYVVSNADQGCRLYSEGHKAETGLKAPCRNVIFTLHVSQKQQDLSSSGIISKISFVDLVGHEMEPDNSGLKALFKALGKGKIRDQASNADMLISDAIMNSKSAIVACAAGEEAHPSGVMKLFDLVKSGSSIRTNPRKNVPDLTKLLTHIRQEIKTVREKIMQQTIPDKKCVEQMESLISELNDVKNTSWEQKIVQSNLRVEERKSNLADKGLLWVLEFGSSSNQDEIKALQERISEMSGKAKEQKETTEKLKEELRRELDAHTKSIELGKSDDQTQARVARIQSMKETFKKESESLAKSREAIKSAKDQLKKLKEAGLDVASFNFEMTVRKLQEDRNRMKKENEQLINDEVEKMKNEVDHERAVLEMTSSSGGLGLDESVQLKNAVELTTLKLEKSTLTMQLDVLRTEKRQLEDHINVLSEKHAKQMEIQQLQNLQTFRGYREVFEEFKVELESRWRGLLDEAIQDAVFLNSRNNELSQENKSLMLEVKQLKDALSLTGAPLPGKSPGLKNV